METPALSTEQQVLVRSELGLVEKLARQEARRFPQVSYEDLVATGNEALARAALRYDRKRGPFGVFAYLRVKGEMRDLALREANARPAPYLRALRLGSEALVSAYEDSQADALNDTPEQGRARLREWAQNCAAAFVTAHVSEVASAAPPNPEAVLGELRERARVRAALEEALAKLDRADADLVREHYTEERLLTEIAENRQVALRTVHRHHKRILAKLRDLLQQHGVDSTSS